MSDMSKDGYIEELERQAQALKDQKLKNTMLRMMNGVLSAGLLSWKKYNTMHRRMEKAIKMMKNRVISKAYKSWIDHGKLFSYQLPLNLTPKNRGLIRLRLIRPLRTSTYYGKWTCMEM